MIWKYKQALIASTLLGLVSIIAPVYILGDLKPYNSPLFPLIRTGIEGLSKYSLSFLFLSGFFVKAISKAPFWLVGIMSMFIFPLAAICEMIADSGSHNLFPLEFFLYTLFSIPSIISAFTAHSIKLILLKLKNKTTDPLT